MNDEPSEPVEKSESWIGRNLKWFVRTSLGAVIGLVVAYIWSEATSGPREFVVPRDQIQVFASSELLSEPGCAGRCTYFATNVLDANSATAWAEGVDGLGIGESLRFEFTLGTVNLQEIQVTPGWQRNSCIYQRNARPKTILVTADTGMSRSYVLADGPGTQRVAFHGRVRWVTIHIEDATPGTPCGGRSPEPDSLISDIVFIASS